jgi:hypothetical protein
MGIRERTKRKVSAKKEKERKKEETRCKLRKKSEVSN